MKNLKTILLLFTAFLTVHVYGQTNETNGIGKLYANGISVFTENNEVKGYSVFSLLDKANKKENIYSLDIFDVNCKRTISVELKRHKDFVLMETAYNGEVFCFAFIDYSKKFIEYLIVDKTGKEKASYMVTDLTKGEIMNIYNSTENGSNVFSGGLLSVKGKGFVRYGYHDEKGYRSLMEMINNDGQSVWKAGSGGNLKEKAFENAYPFYSDEKVIITMFSTREKAYNMNEIRMFLSFHDVATGKELFKVDYDKKYKLLPVGASYDETTKDYYAYGEYFNLKDTPMKDKSLGLYFLVIGQDGTVKNESYTSWEDLIAKTGSNKKKFENNTNVAIHKIIRTKDGKIFAIGEQFKKAVSGTGVAASLVFGSGSNISLAKIALFDMMVFEFGPSFEIIKVNTFEKEKTNVSLSSAYTYFSSSMLATILKYYGQFDYEFTTISPNKETFVSTYINYDREEGKKGYVIGNIAYTKNKVLVSDKISLSDTPTITRVFPAKTGYITIFEYYKKEKKLKLRVEKLNL